MTSIVERIKQYEDQSFLHEDGDILRIHLNSGISEDYLPEFERKNGIILPISLKDLLQYSNGMDLFGVEVFALENMEYFSTERILVFHDWGNGDFDCISVGGQAEHAEIFFMNHSPQILCPLNLSLQGWVEEVIKEIKNEGTLLHPMDYENRDHKGMYSSIIIE